MGGGSPTSHASALYGFAHDANNLTLPEYINFYVSGT